MAYPDKMTLMNWANSHPALWNAGDKASMDSQLAHRRDR